LEKGIYTMAAFVISKGTLVLGSVDDAFDESLIHDWNIAVSINVADELDLCDRVLCRGYKRGLRDDDDTEDVWRVIPDVLDIITRHQEQGEVVLVHCLEGKSRSVCVVLAYLTLMGGMTVDEALERVNTASSRVDIYPAYLNQLRSFLDPVMGAIRKTHSDSQTNEGTRPVPPRVRNGRWVFRGDGAND
jgi:dual specificity protein phosphatase-like protein